MAGTLVLVDGRPKPTSGGHLNGPGQPEWYNPALANGNSGLPLDSKQ